MIDTMPGTRDDGHVPGGNSIDTLCHPTTNVLYLDAARVHETVIAHEFGHAWVQYVDECEDLRTLADARDPQRMRHVGFVQSFVLDLKVNDLLRRKGFDMGPIQEDQAQTLSQLAQALQRGYQPEHPREEVFMALLVADHIVERELGKDNTLAKSDEPVSAIRRKNSLLGDLAERMAEAVRRHGYDSHNQVVACIDDCLLASFAHCGDAIDLDGELLLVNPEEPDLDKFPEWLPQLRPTTKCKVGKHMARNDITSEWPHSIEPTVTSRARVTFMSPEGDRRSDVLLHERIGPPTRYSDLPEVVAENLAMKNLNRTGSYQLFGGPPFTSADVYQRSDGPSLGAHGVAPTPTQPNSALVGETWIDSARRLHRSYMPGLGRFLTAARLREQLQGEHPYGYALNNPTAYTDPSGEFPSYINCSMDFQVKINNLCLEFLLMTNQERYLINRCIAVAAGKLGIDCQGITTNRLACMQRFCSTDGIIECKPIPGGLFGFCPDQGLWNMDRDDPSDDIWINLVKPYGNTYADWLGGQGGQVTFVHELMHACGQHHNNTDLKRECNDIQACCIFEVLVNGNDGHRCVNRIKPPP